MATVKSYIDLSFLLLALDNVPRDDAFSLRT